ncbi:MAG: hypothetical protein ACFFAH_04595 [Promethearchaeota archaeon]
MQCKFLLLNVDLEDPEKYKKLRRLDESKQVLNTALEYTYRTKHRIPYLTGFWGHVSNL